MTLASRMADGVVSAGDGSALSPTLASLRLPAPRSLISDRCAGRIDMPVIKVNDLQYTLRPGENRLGAGADADVHVDSDPAIGVQAIVNVASGAQVVIRRAKDGSAVRVNGVALVQPTPLMHGDKVEIAGKELLYSDDTKAGTTQYVSASDMAALAKKRTGPPRATADTGGRLVSLVDGKEYAIPSSGITIGRDASCGVVVAQNEVSRKHAEIVPVAGGYEVRDFSSNGSFLNGERITARLILSRADVIRIGTEEFRFYADVAPSTGPLPRAALTPATANLTPTVSEPAAITAQRPAPAAAPILALLEITNEGPSKGRQYEIHVPLVHVGRGAHNDIVVADDSVSDTHAKIQRRDDGWYLSDVGSTNGTYVGGQRLVGERRLEGSPDVRFGGVKMIFQPRDSAAPAAKGTRAIVGVDRSKLRPAAPATLQAAATSPAVPPAQQGIPAWIWGIVAIAVAGAIAFFLLDR
jgi:pSer/pThr/pTyr-binding forkhead associated (FHA) protein